MTMNNDEHTTEDDDERSMSPSANNSQMEKMRKISHSEIERRRREKMNRYIDEIAQLLPIDAVKKLDKLTVLRVAVDTIKRLKGSSTNVSTIGFGKQSYLNDNELFELTLATIDQLGSYFFLIIECEKGRICYASNSVESTLGYKPIEFCSQIFFDLIHPNDLDVVRQQFCYERIASSTTNDESSNDAKCLTRLNPQKTCLEVGRRRTFSSRIRTKTKRTFGVPIGTTTTPNDFCTIDFVGYLKEYSLNVEQSNESKIGHERRRGNVQSLTSADVFNAIGTTPVTCLLTMGSLAKRFDVQNDPNQCPERMFLWKLNSDGQFTYVDQISYPLLGYLSHELLGMNFIEFIHEDDRSKLTDIWIRVCRDRQIVTSGFYRFRSKDNVYFTFQTIFEPFIHPWTDDLEIVVARNKLKNRSIGTSTNFVSENETPHLIDSTELTQHLLP